MAESKALLLCSLLWILSAAERSEFTITCQGSEDCALPCRFQSDGKGARIMWYKKKAVVSCTRYGNTSFVVGHNSPADKYKGRTGLYGDQVLEGNATLLLRNVTPNDEGKYFCITMTAPRTDESGIISLLIEAPVREVNMELGDDAVTCNAEGIYPAPTLTWSTDPPADAHLLQGDTRSHKNKLGFYSIQSSLRLKRDITTGHTYICSVSCDINKKTAFLKHEASIVALAGSEAKISCSLPHAVLRSSKVTWSFRGSEPIASITFVDGKPQVKIWDQWKDQVFNNVSVSSGLHLHSLKSEYQGNYTCEVSTPEDKYITLTGIMVAKEATEYTYIFIILGLVYLLCLSYVTLAIFGFKIRRLEERIRQQQINIDETTETLNTNNLSGASINTQAGDQAANQE